MLVGQGILNFKNMGLKNQPNREILRNFLLILGTIDLIRDGKSMGKL